MAGKEPTGVPAQYGHVITWTAQQLDDSRKSLIAAWPKRLRINISGIGLFCQATPQNENDTFTRITPEECLSRVLEGVDAGVVVCGHTHMQFDRTVGGVRVVNAGSIGMPFGEAAAYWLLLASGVQLRRTSYDLVGAADRIRTTSYPEARQFAARNLLRPLSEDQMLAVFTRAEIS